MMQFWGHKEGILLHRGKLKASPNLFLYLVLKNYFNKAPTSSTGLIKTSCVWELPFHYRGLMKGKVQL